MAPDAVDEGFPAILRIVMLPGPILPKRGNPVPKLDVFLLPEMPPSYFLPKTINDLPQGLFMGLFGKVRLIDVF